MNMPSENHTLSIDVSTSLSSESSSSGESVSLVFLAITWLNNSSSSVPSRRLLIPIFRTDLATISSIIACHAFVSQSSCFLREAVVTSYFWCDLPWPSNLAMMFWPCPLRVYSDRHLGAVVGVWGHQELQQYALSAWLALSLLDLLSEHDVNPTQTGDAMCFCLYGECFLNPPKIIQCLYILSGALLRWHHWYLSNTSRSLWR